MMAPKLKRNLVLILILPSKFTVSICENVSPVYFDFERKLM
ncbi:hypothetical protein LEP1GSC060_2218 [Leptospira weilii serovar Ranarum str. ICFT]|uniref:Uncharacterized protein n=1 Tax=Leptospira weilii serovar Ranarum str. ICFT TaxID=1218598 RepID=N1WKC0_9LEPT|nr:hypothetical protein LEP1GSC060_2218 [Leptospira weilii serovar Ranarum str. ICFT]